MSNQLHSQTEKIKIAGEGEKAQYLVSEQNDITVRFALRYPGRLSPELLEQAAGTVVRSIDVLHASFEPRAIEALWVIHEEVGREDYFAFLETQDDPMSVADRIMVKPILPESRAKMHCTLIQGSTDSVVVVRVSHLCADGGDAKYLLEKLAEAYGLLARGESTDTLDLKNGSRSVFQIYKNLPVHEILSAVKPALGAEPTVFPFPEADRGYPHLVRRTIDSDLMQKVKQYGKERNATINDVLLAASSRAYRRLPNVDMGKPVNIMSMMDLRRYSRSGESDGLTNLTGSMSTVLPIEAGESFDKTLEKTAEQTRSVKESPIAGLNGLPVIQIGVKHTPMWLAMKVADKLYGENMPIGMTNLGSFSADALTLDGLRPTEIVFGGPAKKKNGMQIAAAGINGLVTLCCTGEFGDLDAALIARFLEWMEEEMRTAVEGS